MHDEVALRRKSNGDSSRKERKGLAAVHMTDMNTGCTEGTTPAETSKQSEMDILYSHKNSTLYARFNVISSSRSCALETLSPPPVPRLSLQKRAYCTKIPLMPEEISLLAVLRPEAYGI